MSGLITPTWCRCGVARGRQDGWTRDVQTGHWVCPRCRLPSYANARRAAFIFDRTLRVITSEPDIT